MELSRLSTLSLGITILSDVLIPILEDLNDIAPNSLPDLRTVSKQLDGLIVPILYRHINLTPRVIARSAVGKDPDTHNKAKFQVAGDMRRYTRHVSIGVVLDWSLVTHMLQEIEHLVSLT